MFHIKISKDKIFGVQNPYLTFWQTIPMVIMTQNPAFLKTKTRFDNMTNIENVIQSDIMPWFIVICVEKLRWMKISLVYLTMTGTK